MLSDVLFPIGTIAQAECRDGIKDWLIIGNRVVSPQSHEAYDYVGVPTDIGFKIDKNGATNCLYFNHFEIEKVLYNPRVKLED